MLLAQMVRTWGFGEVIIGLIIFMAVIAVALIFAKNADIHITPWLPQIVWIVIAAFVAIWAIRFLLNM